MPEEIINKNVIIEDAKNSDASFFVYLNNQQYFRKKTDEYFFWMFKNTYLNTKLFTAYDRGNPVAFYGTQIHKLNSGLNVSVSVDIIIDKNYRGRGLFTLLEKASYRYALENDCAAMTVFGNLGGMKAHRNLETWRSINKIDTLIFDCKNNLEIIDFELISTTKILSHYLKDDGYRKWRYNANPVYKYDRINVSDNGFAITKIFEDPVNKIRYGDIVELSCNLNDIDLLRELIIKCHNYLLDKGVNFITVWALPHTLLFQLLTSMKFQITTQERYFCLRILKKEFKYLDNIDNWNLDEIDSEVY